MRALHVDPTLQLAACEMASGSLTDVPGSVYELYTTEDVLDMMDELNEPICQDSDDELELDLHDSEDETR